MSTHPTIPIRVRRAAVSVAVVATLLGGAAAIRASAEWTRANAPLSVTPIAPAVIEADLAGQQERAADLALEVAALSAHAAEMRAALDTASDQIGDDTETAKQLRVAVDAAAAKLAALDAQIAQASDRLARMSAAAAAPAPAAPAGGDDDDEHDDEHEDEHGDEHDGEGDD